ncbi:hypothetical protein OED52_13880 [Rhodococcus sp. Z13]|uniref:Uncharacterized protein n=1 Tax=Rhodococcus sacchari TaxID=2962047 RepID=A0ACD4DCQ7_9NOCA|nr:hypothetical protein [Rhodococcus sp. Z13]UYP17761.1 hypothetical protein OED52_13880 [Rhodococcus sp. Z13]
MRWRDDCTCARTRFGHEPDCAIYRDIDDDYHAELLLDADREEAPL